MYKYFIFMISFAGLFSMSANAACVANSKRYTSCKPGYYLSAQNCYRCPKDNTTGVTGTSSDKNTSGLSSCYLPSGTGGTDTSGRWQYTSNCYNS